MKVQNPSPDPHLSHTHLNAYINRQRPCLPLSVRWKTGCSAVRQTMTLPRAS